MLYKENFIENLNEFMHKENLTKKELSFKTNISFSQICSYFRNSNLPNIINSVQIANYFKCTLDFLFGLTEEYNQVEIIYSFDFYNNLANKVFKNYHSFYEFCKKNNIEETYINRWRKGTMPKTETIINLAVILGTSIDELIGIKK